MVVPCNTSFTVRLVHQDVSVYWQEWGQDQGESLDVWLQSRDTAGLQQEVDKMGGKLSVVLDGKTYTLEAGKHFHTFKVCTSRTFIDMVNTCTTSSNDGATFFGT